MKAYEIDAELKVFKKQHPTAWMAIRHTVETLRAKASNAERRLNRLKLKVNNQANDDGLWFQAATAPESYLQGKLKELHAMIETERLQ